MSHGAGEDPARAGNFIHTIDRLCRRPVHSEGVQDSPHVVRPPFLHTWREQRVRQHTKRRGIPLVRLRGSDGWPAILVPPRGPAQDERPVTHVVSRGIPRACPAV